MTEGFERSEEQRPEVAGESTPLETPAHIELPPPDDPAQPESNRFTPPLAEVQLEIPSESAETANGTPGERKSKKKRSKLGSGRGVETMFRTSYRVHVDLTALADNKANIMISINGLIIPIMLFALVPLLQYSEWLIVPSSTLVITCLISIVYAVLSARPRINPNPVTRHSIQADRANILFFGNFAHLTESDFVDGMTSMMSEMDSIYLSMIRDIYGMGKVLSKKFALLKKAYSVFMVGLIVSILLFLGSFILISIKNGQP